MADQRVSRFLRLRRKNGEWRADPRLRSLLLEDGRAYGDNNLCATINRILCDAYGIEYRPTGRAGAAEPGPNVINLKIQADLDRKLEREALRRPRGTTVQDVILDALSRHYDLAAPGALAAA